MKQYDKIIGFGIIAILIFLLGWHAGRIMSPYYASTPIVFEDRACSACPSSTGSLQDLQGESSGNPVPVGTANALTGDLKGLYVASKNSNLFHHQSCSSASTIKPENQVWYSSYEEAVASGKSPSSCTQKLK